MTKECLAPSAMGTNAGIPTQRKRLFAFRLLAIFFSTALPKQVAVVACLLFASLADGLGLATLLPIVTIVSGQPAGSDPVQRTVTGILDLFGLPATLEILLATIVFAVSVKAALVMMAVSYAGYAGAQVATKLRLRLLDALLAVRWGYFTRKPVGYFTNAVNSEAQRASTAYLDVASLIANLIQTAVLIIVSVLLSWRLTLVALVFGGTLVLAFGRLVRAAKRAGRRQTRQTRQLSTRLTDTLIGIKALKAMSRHLRAADLFKADVHALHRNQRRLIFVRQANRLLQEPLLVAFLVAALYVSNKLLRMPIQEVLVMAILLARLLSSIGRAQQAYQAAALSESAYSAIETAIAEAEAQREVWVGACTPLLNREIAFRNVTMAHGTQPVLKDFSLTIPVGKIVALVGPSGAGKTTVVDLLLGLYQPQSGAIEIDGVRLDRIDVARWRRQIGYVPQDVVLFHDSVLANLTLGAPDLGPDDARRALEAAGAWDFVSRLPNGLESTVGERGTLLSGGQRQRIAIARATIHCPSLLIFDEATSALDPATAEAICGNVKDLSRAGVLSVLAISHQPAWARIADHVHRIEPIDRTPGVRIVGPA